METYGRLARSRVMMDENHDPTSTRAPVLVTGADPDPASPNHATVVSTTDARSGVTLGRMRWVLGLSVVAVAVAFLIVWLVARG